MDYAHASERFDQFLADARDALGLSTRHQTFTVVEGVLCVFRARLDPVQFARFAQCLPPVLRAMFIEGWTPASAPLQFLSRTELTREAQALRRDHNFAPDDCIAQVARALRRSVDVQAFERALNEMPGGAREFWSVTPAP